MHTKNNGIREIVIALLRLHGKTFADEIGITMDGNTNEELFRLLYSSLLFSTRISSAIAVQAAQTLSRHGWDSPEKMTRASWQQRVKALDDARYVRYDEGTATRLAEMAQMVIDRYKGDLSNLRGLAQRDPKKERELIEEFKGIGEVGANIFFREVQVVWEELYPFADERALKAARRLGLPPSACDLAKLTDRRSFPRLVAALIRTDLANDYDRVLNEAHLPAHAV
jgi:endonuclease III